MIEFDKISAMPSISLDKSLMKHVVDIMGKVQCSTPMLLFNNMEISRASDFWHNNKQNLLHNYLNRLENNKNDNWYFLKCSLYIEHFLSFILKYKIGNIQCHHH